MTSRWHDVDSAIRDCLEHAETIQALDTERLASHVSLGRPSPGRPVTVWPTGSIGALPRREPLGAIARGRMRRLLGELPPPTADAVVAAAYGLTRTLERALHRRHGSIMALADAGRATLMGRMIVLGLLDSPGTRPL